MVIIVDGEEDWKESFSTDVDGFPLDAFTSCVLSAIASVICSAVDVGAGMKNFAFTAAAAGLTEDRAGDWN